VNMRRDGANSVAANRVSAWLLRLPVAERDPLAQFAAVKAGARQLRRSKVAEGLDLVLRFADWSSWDLPTILVTRLASAVHLYNLVVTNVIGPQVPLYLLGAKLNAIYPQVPLFVNQGLGIAVMSYSGKVYFGLTGDWDLVPDLATVAQSIGWSFGELKAAAETR